MTIYPQTKKRPSFLIPAFLMGCIVTAGLSGIYFNRTNPRDRIDPETIVEIRCDKNIIIRAHYAEIIDEIMRNQK